MADHFEVLVAECLESLDRGEDLASVLARYPSQAAELEPILSLTLDMSELAAAPESVPRPHLGNPSWPRQPTQGRPLSALAGSATSMVGATAAAGAGGPRTGRAGGVGAGPGRGGTQRAGRRLVRHEACARGHGAAHDAHRRDGVSAAVGASGSAPGRGPPAPGQRSPGGGGGGGRHRRGAPNAGRRGAGLVAELGPGTQVLGTPETGEAARLVGRDGGRAPAGGRHGVQAAGW